jgi:hypothetical protein
LPNMFGTLPGINMLDLPGIAFPAKQKLVHLVICCLVKVEAELLFYIEIAYKQYNW